MSKKSIYDVKESEVDIEDRPWNDPMVQQLAWKNIYIVQKQVDFWEPYLTRGQRLFEMYDGQILNDTQRQIYQDTDDKIVIEPPIAKAPIRTLVKHAIESRKSGTIEVEEGDFDHPDSKTNEIQTIDICLKHMEKKTKEGVKIRDAIHDSMVSCYPNIVFFQKHRPTGDNPLKYTAVHPAWNSCLFGPINLAEPDLSDFREFTYFRNYTMAELIEMFPDMEDNITAHWSSHRVDDKSLSSLLNWDQYLTAKDISYMNSIYGAAYGSLSMPGSMMPTFSRMFPLKKKEEVWVKIDPMADENNQEFEHIVIPKTWGKKRKEQWIAENQQTFEGPYQREIVVLWQCTFTQSGLMLENHAHWYQDQGNIPGAIFVPCLVNGKPSGPMVDMGPELLRNCVAEIEYLDDLRKNDGWLSIVKEGGLTEKSAENFAAESSKAHGVVMVTHKFKGSLNDAVKFQMRQPSSVWREYGDHTKANMEEETRINSTMQGETAPRQSNVAKQAEIGAALGVNALYFDNYDRDWQNFQQVKLGVIPFNYDESNMKVEAFMQRQNLTISTTLNVPQFGATGEQTHVLNDVTSSKYKWMISPVDDSPTAKARQMQDAILIINGSAGPLMKSDPTGKLLANFWQALDNPIINEAGRKLAQDAQIKQQQSGELQKSKIMADAQSKILESMAASAKAGKSGVSVSLTGEQLAQYPQLQQFFIELKQWEEHQEQQRLSAANPQQPQPGQPGQQQPQPGPGGQGSGVPEPQMAPAAA